jgi:hypothetical protein
MSDTEKREDSNPEATDPEVIEEDYPGKEDDVQAAIEFEERKEYITEIATATAKRGGSFLACAVLDMFIVRPYIQTSNILLYGGAAAMLGFTMGNVFFGFLAGFLLGILFLSYPFAVSEKYETAELYKSLGLRAENVVAGRYLFTFGFALTTAIGALGLSSLGVHFSRAFEVVPLTPEVTNIMIVVILLFLSVIMIQLPFYFRLDFVSARFAGLAPLSVAAILVGGLTWLASGDGLAVGMRRFSDLVNVSEWTILAALIIFVCIGIISYRISLAAYKK